MSCSLPIAHPVNQVYTITTILACLHAQLVIILTAIVIANHACILAKTVLAIHPLALLALTGTSMETLVLLIVQLDILITILDLFVQFAAVAAASVLDHLHTVLSALLVIIYTIIPASVAVRANTMVIQPAIYVWHAKDFAILVLQI